MGRETAQAAAGTQGGGGGALDERGAGVPTTSAPGRASGSAMSKPTSQGSCDRSGRLKPSWWHDAFNVAALGVINSANCWYLLYGTGFRFFWWSTVLYFLADFAWIAACPHCVKSPGVLAGHHLVAAAYTLLPFFYPSTASKMSFVMTVEVRAPAPSCPARLRVPLPACMPLRSGRRSVQIMTWRLSACRSTPGCS